MGQDWRWQAAADPNSSSEILRELAKDPTCRLHLAENPSTPPDVLDLIGDRDSLIHLDFTNRRLGVSAVLRNPNCQAKTIEKILKWTDGVLNVYQEGEPQYGGVKNRFIPAAASNPNTPEKLLRDFYDLGDSLVDSCLVQNPNLPQDLIQKYVERLVGTEDRDVAHSINQIASNPSLRVSDWLRLHNHKLDQVRDAASRNRSAKPENLMLMITDRYFMARYGLMHNPNFPLEGLEALASENSFDIRENLEITDANGYFEGLRLAVNRNPNATDELRTEVNDPGWLSSKRWGGPATGNIPYPSAPQQKINFSQQPVTQNRTHGHTSLSRQVVQSEFKGTFFIFGVIAIIFILAALGITG